MSKKGACGGGDRMLSGTTAANTDGVPLASQPRQPRNLQDLLRYSTEASDLLGNSTPGNSTGGLDDEAKKFLEGAIKSLTVDIVEELLKQIRLLEKVNVSEGNDNAQVYEEALDIIMEHVDNLDVANDFHKIGGFRILKPCLQSTEPGLRWRSAELIAQLCQNNPYCQNKILEIGLMPQLLKMIDVDMDTTVRIKALYGVSSLARGSEEGFVEFTKAGGLSVLLRALQSDSQKLNTKSAFLLSSLCQWKTTIKDDLIKMGYVEQIVSKMTDCIEKGEEGHSASLEHLLSALLGITDNHYLAQEICRKPELHFKDILDTIVKSSNDMEQYKEENEYAKMLIETVFGESNDVTEDR